jgi:formaldehyde-activating enzyme involved in methanogenesis
MFEPMFERDLLYPAVVYTEPGSIHVTVLKPDIQGKIPILITPKTNHNPFDYADVIIGIIQDDVFKRARIDIKNQGIFFFKKETGEYIKLVYEDGKKITETVSSL